MNTNNGVKWRILSAKKGVPATSLPCYRLFNAAGILVDRRRSSLRPDIVQQMTELAKMK